MTLAGLAPLIKPFLADKTSDWPEGLAVFGFFGGAAFLTAFSFRNALRNLSSNKSVDHRGSWSEKMIVLAVAMLCAGLIACIGQTIFGTIVWSEIRENAFEPVLLLVIIVCSVGFWTLVARSVPGGLALAAVAQFVLYLLLVLFARTIDHMLPGNPGGVRLSHEPGIHSALGWFVGGLGFSYAALMLWLGRKKFASMELPKKSDTAESFQSA